MKIKVEVIELKLKTTWKLSRNSADVKQNIILSVAGARSEIAPNIRYGESVESSLKQITSFFDNLSAMPKTLHEVKAQMKKFKGHHSTRFGIEALLIHNLGQSMSELFSIPKPQTISTSFSLPIMDAADIKKYLEKNGNFKSYKIKVDKNTAIETVKMVQSLTDKKLRIDANEGFEHADEVMDFLSQVKVDQIEFLEQPLPSTSIEESKKLFKLSPVIIIADESVEDHANFSELKEMFHGINVKLMKTGGYITAIKLLAQAREHKMKTMIGCMIETSQGIWSAMQINSLADYLDLDGYLLIENDPFNLVNNQKGQLSIV
jgi:L-Ala-D/L-Glu epimerase